jgi:hypothetical protein
MSRKSQGAVRSLGGSNPSPSADNPNRQQRCGNKQDRGGPQARLSHRLKPLRTAMDCRATVAQRRRDPRQGRRMRAPGQQRRTSVDANGRRPNSRAAPGDSSRPRRPCRALRGSLLIQEKRASAPPTRPPRLAPPALAPARRATAQSMGDAPACSARQGESPSSTHALDVRLPRKVEFTLTSPTCEHGCDLSRSNRDEVSPHVPLPMRIEEQMIHRVGHGDVLILRACRIRPSFEHARHLVSRKSVQRRELPVWKKRPAHRRFEALPHHLNVASR